MITIVGDAKQNWGYVNAAESIYKLLPPTPTYIKSACDSWTYKVGGQMVNIYTVSNL